MNKDRDRERWGQGKDEKEDNAGDGARHTKKREQMFNQIANTTKWRSAFDFIARSRAEATSTNCSMNDSDTEHEKADDVNGSIIAEYHVYFSFLLIVSR